jgi:hypothetical protein
MKNSILFILLATMVLAVACSNQSSDMQQTDTYSVINESIIKNIVDELVKANGEEQRPLIQKGVKQIANLWITGTADSCDGTTAQFQQFCLENYVADKDKKLALFDAAQRHFEIIYGHFNKMSLDLKRPAHLEGYDVTKIDEMIAGYEPITNFQNDFYKNKIAFVIALNFPYYSLQEKTELGEHWSRLEWAYARLGDIFTSRVPAALLQEYSRNTANADYYISNYNIYMGKLVDEAGKTYFPADMKLISHWNLRDEIKSLYADSTPDGLKKQKMVQDVMLHIIKQDIPQQVINSDKYTWNPTDNKLFENGSEIAAEPEPNTRYQYLLDNFNANQRIDNHRKNIGNAINQTFDVDYEMPQPQVEQMYVDFISSPQVKQIAEIIKKRLGRDLQPFDIWYDGFKTRSNLDATMLDGKTRKLYPNTAAFKNGIPTILTKLGFAKDKATEIASHIEVDPAKGAGHAWGADMKGESAHLRTRIGQEGMDYKGYNIAVHELGHNVEQTLSLYDVDYWFLRGVPNTAFTEAWAFTFQNRDLQLLGIKTDDDKNAEMLDILDQFWSCYEIMGVSLVDQRVWKWMYDNPNCNAKELNDAVNNIACEVWNSYYAPVFGMKDIPLLAIYSHMIDYPLYLSAYPMGHIIEFQMAKYMEGKNIGTEMTRICTQGRILPNIWMKKAVGSEVSTKPLLDATTEAINAINQ